ncbi:MAG: hypothetical protein GY872_10410 [Roseibacillus sp.]|nr:hypothetical protein [Myxococcales bacterium]MCP4730472.1 hypothetical protein [Roseibacillus sp.]
MLSFAETKLALVGGLAFIGQSVSSDGFEGWTLPTFSVAMVVYLLWKGERQERQQQRFREESLKAQIHVKDAIEALREEIIDMKWGRRD